MRYPIDEFEAERQYLNMLEDESRADLEKLSELEERINNAIESHRDSKGEE